MNSDTPGDASFSTLVPGFLSNPYPAYAHLRTGPPIFWSNPEGGWILHRYADVAAILADSRFVVVELAQFVGGLCARSGKNVTDLEAVLSEVLFLRNSPMHNEARQFLAAALTGRPLSSYMTTIEEIARDLLTKAVRNQVWDAACQYSDLLPPLFMAWLLGLDEEEVGALITTVSEVTKSFDRGRSPRFYQRVNSLVEKARWPLDEAVARHRREPRDDVLSRMITLSDNRFHLDDRTIASRALFLLLAGVETTSTLIGNAIAAVLDHAEAARSLVAHPERAAAAIEEALRYDAPIQQVTRVATTDAVIAGQRISAGDRLVVLIGAANRDPVVCHNPDRFDLDRPGSGHIAFGGGTHFCLGASLARLEAQIALREFMTTHPRTIDLAARRWRPHSTLRRLASLPVVLSQ
jgi:pimeloyl-[acyl-carrier protein] synthase